MVIVSELDKQESRAISGVPGLSEIPGLNNITDIDDAEQQLDPADHHDAARDSRNAGAGTRP